MQNSFVQHTFNQSSLSAYYDAVKTIDKTKIPFLIGGNYAFSHYTGIVRQTKDFDIFVRPQDCQNVLQALSDAGYETEITFPHWLGKAFHGDYFIDIIFGSGNGITFVDDEWFENASLGEFMDIPIKMCPPEELIWMKSFVMERECYHGADVIHLLHACTRELDWSRLLSHFGLHWRILLSYLVLFGFVYPCERSQLPTAIMNELLSRMQAELTSFPSFERICQGTLLSREQYLVDIECWHYQDARLQPEGLMSIEDVSRWTNVIRREASNKILDDIEEISYEFEKKLRKADIDLIETEHGRIFQNALRKARRKARDRDLLAHEINKLRVMLNTLDQYLV